MTLKPAPGVSRPRSADKETGASHHAKGPSERRWFWVQHEVSIGTQRLKSEWKYNRDVKWPYQACRTPRPRSASKETGVDDSESIITYGERIMTAAD